VQEADNNIEWNGKQHKMLTSCLQTMPNTHVHKQHLEPLLHPNVSGPVEDANLGEADRIQKELTYIRACGSVFSRR
jgi:hypothetical protein